jgi:hypothetical protein
LSFQVPKIYRDEPLLIGRAKVEFVVEKSSGASKFVDTQEGGTSSRSAFEITLDGYSAPVTAGKFAKLVRDGKFDSMEWSSGYLTLLTGKGADPGATLPLEILPAGVLHAVASFRTYVCRMGVQDAMNERVLLCASFA